MTFDHLHADDSWTDVCSKGLFSGLIRTKPFVVVHLPTESHVEVVDENHNV